MTTKEYLKVNRVTSVVGENSTSCDFAGAENTVGVCTGSSHAVWNTSEGWLKDRCDVTRPLRSSRQKNANAMLIDHIRLLARKRNLWELENRRDDILSGL